MHKLTPYEIALDKIEEAAKTGATELDLSGLAVEPLRVFLSHDSRDKIAVRELYDSLKAENWIDPWLDKAKLLPGQDWRVVIEDAIENADIVIICLSNQSISKEGYVQKEMRYAYEIALEKPEDTIYLIPLRLEDCPVPRGLRSRHWVDYFGSEKQKEFPNLLHALQLRYEQKKSHNYRTSTTGSDSDVSDTQLMSLPVEIGKLVNLISLDLSYNKLTHLPPSIRNLKRLRYLRLDGNALPIPTEVYERTKEPHVILDYYFSHLKKALNECKVLVVGQGSVGKTSLVQQLVFGKFNPIEAKTEGIAITQWQIENLNPESENGHSKINLNLWDFGGQEIMHATHQFFLTKRSLYLLVLDSRLTQEENRVEYWLKIIQSFGGDSPVLIVGNKTDQHPLDIDRSGLQKKYPNIVGILETSAATGKGLDELYNEIAKQINSLPHVRDLLPESWFMVKKQLEVMGRGKNFISRDEFLALCANNDVSEDSSQRTLISFMHDLGIVLHFQDDPRLEALGILNPQWVTNGVYKILNSHTLFQNKGVLTIAMLNEILNLPEYPHDKHLFIVDMMKKFELCYDIMSDKIFLVPDLLPKDEPFIGEWNDALAFQYHYPVLPSSVITRFIVRMNEFIYKTVWRSGVVLKNGDNTALVKADIEDRKIYIWINGMENTRRDFLAIIRSQLENIHRTITKLEVREKVPVPSHPDAEAIDYNLLLQMERKGIETHYVQAGEELVTINISQLLNGVARQEELQRRVVTNIYIGGDVKDSNLIIGDANEIGSQ